MNEIRIEPNNTFAIVVGIDRYPKLEAMDANYRLNNAVREAFDFTNWLLEKSLSADRIMLFVSDAEDPQALPEPLKDHAGQTVIARNPVGVRDAILHQSFMPAAAQNVLFVYWAGHGSTDDDQHQLLWDQNYHRDNDRLVYDLEEVKRALRAEQWRAFPRQIILVNACANGLTGRLNKQPFDDLRLDGQLNRKQFTLCAASPGEFAGDGAKKEPSEFFKLLLKTLQEHTRGERLLNLGEVCRRICEEAERLRHTPRIEWINWNGSRSVWNSDDPLLRLIYERVRKLTGIRFEHLKESYQKCVEEAESVGTIKEMIAHLNGARKNRKQTTRYGPVLDFALHLIRYHSLDDFDRELMEFFQKEAAYEMPLLYEARAKIKEEHRRPVAPLYLSVIPGEAGDTFAFYLHDGDRWEMAKEDVPIAGDETLEAAVHRIIHAHHEVTDFSEELHFHFFLRVEQLSLELHEWKDPTRFGAHSLEEHHRVALRCLERAKGIGLLWGFAADRWQRKARKLKNRNLPRLRINWFDPGGACDFEAAVDEHECAGFHSPPNVELLRQALQEGLPLLVWPRGAAAAWEDCRAALDAIETGSGLDGAQKSFRLIRHRHREAPFAVLWDDPDHNPYAPTADAQRVARVPFTDIA